MRKVYPIMAILIILLYATIILNQKGIVPLGDAFGYLFYVIVGVGLIAGIWLLIKPPKKAITQ